MSGRISNGQCISCMRKRPYKTKVDADLAIAEIWADRGVDLNKYRCPVCSNWHLTSRQRWTIDG